MIPTAIACRVLGVAAAVSLNAALSLTEVDTTLPIKPMAKTEFFSHKDFRAIKALYLWNPCSKKIKGAVHFYRQSFGKVNNAELSSKDN